MLLGLIATGLYQFHQRAYFHEVVVRLVVGVALGSVLLAVAYYAFPTLMLAPKLAALSVLIALVLLLLLRFGSCAVSTRMFFDGGRWSTVRARRAAVISDLKRRADRRGFQVVGTIAAPGDSVEWQQC